MTAPMHINSVDAVSGARAVLRDLGRGLALGRVWRAFAWDEVQNRYRRSLLGVAWIAIAYAFFVIAILMFFRGFAAREDTAFLHYVAVGLAAFQFLVGILADGCQVFVGASTWLKSTALPYSIYVYKSIARSLFPFAIQLTVAFLLMLATGWRPTFGALLALPALGIYLVNAVWVQILLGHVAARWRDVGHLIGTIQRVLFFATPILWVYDERSGGVRALADFNPLTHYIEVFRAPLLGEAMNPVSWPLVLVFTAIGWLAAIAVSSRMRRRLPFLV